MDVWMRARESVATVLASTARQGLTAHAHQSLPQPEGQALLAYARGAMEKKRTREGIATNGVVETLPERFVAVNGEQGHGVKLIHCGTNPDELTPSQRL